MNKKLMLSLSIVFAAVVFFVAIPMTTAQVQQNKTVTGSVVALPKSADLRIDFIEAYMCQCEDTLKNVDAIMINQKINVGYWNAGPSTVNAKLLVYYYDLKASKNMVQMRSIANLKPNTGGAIEVLSGFQLIKRSTGIKAEIQIDTPGATDPNLRNNKKLLIGCFYNLI